MESRHISEDLVIAFLGDDCSSQQRNEISAHLESCRRCKKEVNFYRVLLKSIGEMLPETGEVQDSLKQKIHESQVYYSKMEPANFTPLIIVQTGKGLASLIFASELQDDPEKTIRTLFPQKWVIPSHAETVQTKNQIEEYLSGKREVFDVAIDDVLIGGGFQHQTLLALKDVSYGQTITYGALATKIGNPKSVRAVGRALGANPIPIIIPCHRVVAGNKKLGGFTGGVDLKKKLLRLEGADESYYSTQMDLFQ